MLSMVYGNKIRVDAPATVNIQDIPFLYQLFFCGMLHALNPSEDFSPTLRPSLLHSVLFQCRGIAIGPKAFPRHYILEKKQIKFIKILRLRINGMPKLHEASVIH